VRYNSDRDTTDLRKQVDKVHARTTAILGINVKNIVDNNDFVFFDFDFCLDQRPFSGQTKMRFGDTHRRSQSRTQSPRADRKERGLWLRN
jgi:hypothetical protein